MLRAFELGRVKVVDEAGYRFGSADNIRRYDHEIDLTDGHSPSSVHGLVIDGKPSFVIADSAGASGIHEHSLHVAHSAAFVAVGAHVISINLDTKEINWVLQTDIATCFGVHWNDAQQALISHGEIFISRLSPDGKMIWQTAGADIISEGCELRDDQVVATDFNGKLHYIDYDTGKASTVPA